MAGNRDTIELMIDILGQDGLDKLAAAADKLRASTKAAADTYEVLDTVVAKSVGVVGTYEVATDGVNRELDDLVAKSLEATRAQRAMAESLEGVGRAAAPLDKATAAGEKLARSGHSSARSMMELGRVVQDFQGGGILGITNNMEGMAIALGLGPGIAGVATLAAVALAAFMPKLKELFAGTAEADDGLKSFRESLDKTRGAVAEINRESNSRVAALVRERDALQAVVDKHNEQIAAIKKLRGLQAAGTTEREHERAANLQALVGGQQGDLVNEVAAGMATPGQRAGRARSRGEIESQIEGWRRNLAATPEGDVAARANLERLIAGGRRRLASLDATEADERRRAEGLVAGAVVGGRAGDLDEVLGRLPADSRFRGALAGQTGGALDRDDDEARAFDDHIERVQEATKGRNERARRDKAAAARKRAEDARNARDAKAAGKAGRKAGVEHQADELISHGPEIVGEAFGPRAAAMAANANPAEVGEIKSRTMKNLEEGQAPYAALLDAFREVSQAAARNAEETRRFAGQLNGVRGRIQPSSESPANFITN